MGVGADGARVYVADGATLIALDRANGQTLWQTSLANNIQTACEEDHPCLQIVGEQVVTLARDGTMQAFAGATGAPLWSYRLNSQPRRFLTNNDQVIVIDTDANNRAVVLILNAGNGDRIFELQPGCAFPNITMRPHASDQFLVTPDGSSLLIVGSGTYACAWRYNLSDGALVWKYTSPDVLGPLPFSWSMSSLALADPALYFVKEEGDATVIYALDSRIADATPQPLYSIEDYDVTLQYTLGDLLMVSATPNYARDEVELWAIERSSGERRWQRKLGTEHTFDDWVTRPTDQGIFLALCFWNVDECRFEVLDLATGTSRGQVRVDGGTPFAGGAWRGQRGYLTIDGALYAVDLRTAQIEYTWP
jgi:outer membrane protein assembly factor BamB